MIIYACVVLQFFTKEKLDVAKEFIEGTIHCKPGAANTLLERVYSLLTNRMYEALNTAWRISDVLFLAQFALSASAAASLRLQ